jgi:thiamine-phosphate pyrophosphorylase
MKKINDYSLYLVITSEYGLGKTPQEITSFAISGGVDVIQLREKNTERNELLKLALEIKELCNKSNVTFIVNDDPIIAKESDADGVHLGQEDIKKYSISKTRDIIGKDKIIGISTHSLDELKQASESDVDYIAFGPIFPTKTKDYFLDTKDVKEALTIAKKPLFFIGGINLFNIDEIISKGAKNIAVIRSIIQQNDITQAVLDFKQKLKCTALLAKGLCV